MRVAGHIKTNPSTPRLRRVRDEIDNTKKMLKTEFTIPQLTQVDLRLAQRKSQHNKPGIKTKGKYPIFFTQNTPNPTYSSLITTNFSLSASPFGVVLEDRAFGSSAYRYTFQNQEHDDELKGEGNSVNFTYRMHDPRLGRFLSEDKLSHYFPWNSTYAFAENRVIDGIELEGGEFLKTGTYKDFRVVSAQKKLDLSSIYIYPRALAFINLGIVKPQNKDNETVIQKNSGPNDALMKQTSVFTENLNKNYSNKKSPNTAQRLDVKQLDTKRLEFQKNQAQSKLNSGATIADAILNIISITEPYWNSDYHAYKNELNDQLVAMDQSAALFASASKYFNFTAKEQVDLINYMVDFKTLPAGDPTYVTYIQMMGQELYNHRQEIEDGTYSFTSEPVLLITPTYTSDGNTGVFFPGLMGLEGRKDNLQLQSMYKYIHNVYFKNVPPSGATTTVE